MTLLGLALHRRWPARAVPAVTHLRRLGYTAPALALFVQGALSACGKHQPTQPVTLGHDTTVPAGSSAGVEARTSQIVTDGSSPVQVFDDFTLA
ncbi:MAG: hypothetical protein M3154_01185 [Candidatus Eremiobacteraeota bacterium]|nr:hypothetical protein [Candidatus Eremiobacteraeota bacterium]